MNPKLRRFQFLPIMLMATLLAWVGPAKAQETDAAGRWLELQDKFEASKERIREKAETERRSLRERFAGALVKLEEDLQKRGRLEELLAVRKEREEFQKTASLGTEGSPDLVRMRTVYAESLVPIDKVEKEEMGRLLAAYLKQLEPLQADLTRAGEIEKALAVRNEAERIRGSMASGDPSGVGKKTAASLSSRRLEFQEIPEIRPDPVGEEVFALDLWPPQVALPKANYRIVGKRYQGDDLGREILLAPGSVFGGSDSQPRWIMGRALLVANEVEFDGFGFEGDLSSQLFFVKCHFKNVTVGKGGPWLGGRFMTRWQFRECQIEGAFATRWNSKLLGVQMANCEVAGVEFPPIEYDKDDEPSEWAGQPWAQIRNSHFQGCVVPVSVLSAMDDCSFEDCRFVDDPAPVTFANRIARTIYLENCQWEVKALPAEFKLEQKRMSDLR